MAEKADFTYEIFQNALTDKDLEYDCKKHQPYFEFQIGDDKVLIGMDKIIECLALAEHLGEIPELGIYFWQSVRERFNIRHEDYDIAKNLHCPNHGKSADCIVKNRPPCDITAYNIDILQLARENFDRCIYLIKHATGLVISDALAEQIAKDYMAHPGYMTYDINKENIPWIMAYCMRGISLIHRLVKDGSPLHMLLQKIKNIDLVPIEKKENTKQLYRIEPASGKYIEISFIISKYRFSVDNTSKLHDYLKLNISTPDGEGTYKTLAKKEIEVSPFAFNRLVHASKPIYRNTKLLDIGSKYLRLQEKSM